MKTILTLLLFTYNLLGFSQDSVCTSKTLTDSEIKTIFTKEVKASLKINFQIYKAYEYKDKLGKHYLLLTERIQDEHAKNDSIKAINILVESKTMSIQWTINDFRLKANEVSKEESIWFWGKYLELKDLDGDGIIEPIIIYGSSGINGIGDGRVKILTYYKGKKMAIRHQNGELDSERNTKVDKEFYLLPLVIQKRVIEIMTNIKNETSVIFPYGWEKAMTNKKLAFDERHK